MRPTTATKRPLPDGTRYEDIEVVTIPLEDAVHMAMNGSISDGKTMIALFRTAARRKAGNQ